jgi:hypothetical protein
MTTVCRAGAVTPTKGAVTTIEIQHGKIHAKVFLLI